MPCGAVGPLRNYYFPARFQRLRCGQASTVRCGAVRCGQVSTVRCGLPCTVRLTLCGVKNLHAVTVSVTNADAVTLARGPYSGFVPISLNAVPRSVSVPIFRITHTYSYPCINIQSYSPYPRPSVPSAPALPLRTLITSPHTTVSCHLQYKICYFIAKTSIFPIFPEIPPIFRSHTQIPVNPRANSRKYPQIFANLPNSAYPSARARPRAHKNTLAPEHMTRTRCTRANKKGPAAASPFPFAARAIRAARASTSPARCALLACGSSFELPPAYQCNTRT